MISRTWLDEARADRSRFQFFRTAVDRGDRDRIIDCYAAESYDDHGALRGAGEEFAGMICSANHSVAVLAMHHLSRAIGVAASS